MQKKLLSEIKKHNKIIIHRHEKPDGDALGSQFGLKEIIIDNFPNKEVLVIGNTNEFSENSIKNIFKEEFDKISIEEYDNSLVIVTDTANIERIKGKDFFRGEIIFKIDHHKTFEKYGNFEWIDSEASSTSEMITRFARLNKLNITSKAAKYLLTGIITDTGRFMFNSVKAETFIEAAVLMQSGAKTSTISNLLNNRNISFIRMQGEILSNIKFEDGVSSYMMPKNMHKKYGVDYNSASSSVYMLMSFSEAEYAVFGTFDEENNIWKGSLRSRKKPINKIAEKHNGGGHEMASGFKFIDKKEFKLVVKEVKELK